MDRAKISKPISKPRLAIPDVKVRPNSARLRPSQIVERKLREEQAARERERKRILARTNRKRASNIRHQAIKRKPTVSESIPWYDDGSPEKTITHAPSEPVANNYSRTQTSTRTNDYSEQAIERKLQQMRQNQGRKRQRIRQSSSESSSSSEQEYDHPSPKRPSLSISEVRQRKNKCEVTEEQSNKEMSRVIAEKFAALTKNSGPVKKHRRAAPGRRVGPVRKKKPKVVKPHVMGADIEPVNSVAGGCFKIKPKPVIAAPTKTISLDNILDHLF